MLLCVSDATRWKRWSSRSWRTTGIQTLAHHFPLVKRTKKDEVLRGDEDVVRMCSPGGAAGALAPCHDAVDLASAPSSCRSQYYDDT